MIIAGHDVMNTILKKDLSRKYTYNIFHPFPGEIYHCVPVESLLALTES